MIPSQLIETAPAASPPAQMLRGQVRGAAVPAPDLVFGAVFDLLLPEEQESAVISPGTALPFDAESVVSDLPGDADAQVFPVDLAQTDDAERPARLDEASHARSPGDVGAVVPLSQSATVAFAEPELRISPRPEGQNTKGKVQASLAQTIVQGHFPKVTSVTTEQQNSVAAPLDERVALLGDQVLRDLPLSGRRSTGMQESEQAAAHKSSRGAPPPLIAATNPTTIRQAGEQVEVATDPAKRTWHTLDVQDNVVPSSDRPALSDRAPVQIASQAKEPLAAASQLIGAEKAEKAPALAEAMPDVGAAFGSAERAIAGAQNQSAITGPSTAGPETARHVANQIGMVVSGQPGGTTEIALNPEELGRVRLSMTAVDQTITLNLQAERPETADLLRRHIDTLAQEFRALGYDNIAFSFGGDERPTQDETSAQSQFDGDSMVPDTSESEAATMQQSGQQTLLDLRM